MTSLKRRVSSLVRALRRKSREEDGAVMILVAVGLVAFLSVASLTVDLGLRYYQKSEMQNALDAAALAAAGSLPDKTRARQTAIEYLEKNGVSSNGAVIEFPEQDVIRVSKAYDERTLFASVFNEDKMHINAHAAAKYMDKALSINFDYLMFYGEDSTFDLRGDIRQVAGSIFGNGNVLLNYNDGGDVYNVESARQVVYDSHRPTFAHTVIQSGAARQAMPDWDELIMSICPTASDSAFKVSHSHVSANRFFPFVYTGGQMLTSLSGSARCYGDLSTSYSNETVTIVGDLYVDGNFTPQRPVRVTGNVYVGGNLRPAWGMGLRVDGNLYVEGSCEFSGNTTVVGETYAGGDIIINNTTTAVFGGPVYTMGSFVKNWGNNLTTKSNVYAWRRMTIDGGGQNKIGGSLYVRGKNETGSVCYLSGPLNLNGDVWCGNGNIRFGGNGDCVIKGYIYSAGGIETLSGGDIALNGCMIAEGDIDIEGASHTYNDSGATLSLYSRRGNVVLGSQGTALNMWGIVYAPKGDIRIRTNGLTIYGSLVGNTLTCDIGSGFYIGKNTRSLPFEKTIKAAALVE